MSGTFVKSFTHLKDRPKSDRALPMLQRIASLVKPIMRKHSWVLPVLAEFFPESPNLVGLNMNMGQKILLRLRPAHAPDTFYDEEEVVQTMLHELTHNVHGPHDEKFYKFLSGLQDEYEALQRSGYAGEGFFSKGQRLGTNVSHDLPPHLARAKALEAAEKRRKIAGVLGSGGRLGGRSPGAKNMTPRELAAQAAERRARDEKACGSGALAEREAAKAAKDSIEDKVIDLTGDDSDTDVIVVDRPPSVPGPSKIAISSPSKQLPSSISITPAKNRVTSSSRPANANANLSVPSSSLNRPNPYPKPTKQDQKAPSPEWACSTCTLLNNPRSLQCDGCLSNRPPDEVAGWTCMTCGEVGMPHQFWTCRFCGTMKTQS